MSCAVEALDGWRAETHGATVVVSTFVNSRLGGDVLAELLNLKLIVTRSTSYEHIDCDWYAARGVVVVNMPDHGDVTKR